MGWNKSKRPILAAEGIDNRGKQGDFQELTGASTGTDLNYYGVSKLVVTSTQGTGETITGATGTNISFSLAAPVAGAEKKIIIDNNSTYIVQVRLSPSSAAGLIFGTTKNALRWSTGSTAPPAHVELLGLSTSQWAILNISSTSIALAGSTY